MTRVLLVNPPSPEALGAPLLGQQYVAAALLAAGVEVRVVDAAARHFSGGADAVAEAVDTFAPDMHQVVKLAERIREGDRPGASADYASFDRIVQVVAERANLRPGDLSSKRRHREVAQARQLALLLGRRLTGHSLDALGGMIGGRDHSTVLYSIRQAEERVANDPALQRDVAEMTQKILDREQDD